MLTFFHGWRRKMGAATFVMACVFAVLWMRAIHSVEELIWFETYGVRKVFVSSPAGISLEHHVYLDPEMLTSGYVPEEIFAIPYQSLIGLPTLLSLYLLLSKSRPAKNQTDDARNPAKTSDPR